MEGNNRLRCDWCYRPSDDRGDGWTAFRRDDLERADFQGDESESVRIFCPTCAGLELGWLARNPAPIPPRDETQLD